MSALLFGCQSQCTHLVGDCAGDWDTAGKRDAARPAAGDEEENEDDDAFGDFEDLETGPALDYTSSVMLGLSRILRLSLQFSLQASTVAVHIW